MTSLTDTQLTRLWSKAYARVARRFNGGTQYGIDWPTLWAVYPTWAHTLKMIREEMRRR